MGKIRNILAIALCFIIISFVSATHETNVTLETTGDDLLTGYDVLEVYSFYIYNLGPDSVENINISIPSYISVLSEDPPPMWNALSKTSYVYFNTASSGLVGGDYFNISIKSVLDEDRDIVWNISSADNTSYFYNVSKYSYLRTTPPAITFHSIDPLEVLVQDDDGVSKVFYRWENETTGPWTEMVYSGGFYVSDIPYLVQDVYTIRVEANDSLGNVHQETTVYIVDSSPPEIYLYSPQETTYDSWDIFLNYSVTDNYDTLIYCVYRLDSATIPLGYMNAGQIYSQHVVVSKDGSHVIYMTCYDSVNNQKQTEPVVFTVETTSEYEPPPQVYYPPETGVEEELSVQSSLLSIVLEVGTNRTIYLQLSNNLNESVIVRTNSSSFIEPFVQLPPGDLQMEPNSVATIPINIVVDQDAIRGVYTGDIGLYTETTVKTVPLMLEVTEELQTLIYSSINIIDDDIIAGETIDLQVKLFNLGSTSPQSILISYLLRRPDNNTILFNKTEQRDLTGVSTFYDTSLVLPQLSEGYYLVEISVQSDNYTDSSLASFKITEASLLTIEFFGLKLYQILIIAVVLIFSLVIIIRFSLYLRKKIVEMRNAKKRVVQAVENVPKEGGRSVLVGEIVETNQKAYLSLDETTKHVLVSGGTGAGKTVAAMTLVEEALLNNVGVVVFDPTAQWTGFSKENNDTKMVTQLKNFDLEPRKFKTEIIRVDDTSYDFDFDITPGTISVLVLDSLTSDDLDIFVKKVLEGLFARTWQENDQLKLLLVFDEVHRLLPRYGGKRRGIPLIERAVRECRKWGIGVIMVSQVLTDFKAAIRANIGTEVQMRTEFEGDIRRIKSKYGSGISTNLTKLSVGWGMVQNPEYNKGKPYFVKFRPTMHQPRSISKEDIVRIKNYQQELEKIENKLKTFERQGIDTSSVGTELSLAKDKLMNLQFAMLDAYLKSINEKIESMK